MKKIFKITLMAILLTSSLSYSQFDARQIPSYLRYDYEEPLMKFGKARVLVKGDRHVEGPKLDIPDYILSEDGFKIVNVSGTNGAQDETWIAYNPANPSNIVGSSNNTRYNHAGVGYKMAAYYTTDGGNSWGVSTTPSNMDVYIERPSNGGMTNFDPGLAFDTEGNLYYSYGFAQIGSDDESSDNGVFVNTSTDGGKSWLEPVPVVLETSGNSNQAFHDRYSITSDLNENSPYKDRIYIAWQRFKRATGVVFSYSKDKNENWSPLIQLPGSGQGTQAPMPAVGPNGEVYVVWREYGANQKTDMEFQRSTDGGDTWLTSSKLFLTVGNLGTINTLSGRNVLADKQDMRISSCPYIAVDNSNGPRRGWIYVVTAGRDDNGASHVMLVKSSDMGNTWTAKQVIDENTNGTDVFFPSITVDPVTGMVSIFYYSSQNDVNNKGVDGYVAVSFDGKEFNNFRVTPETWYIDNPQDVSYQGEGNFYWGDYSSITSYNGTAYPLFWMPNSPNGTYYSVTSYIAIISALPNPPADVEFENTYENPTLVKLDWTDPTTNKLGGDIGDFSIVIYKGSQQIAEVPKGIQTFSDNSAVVGEVFVYNLKTKTDDGLESPFVTVTGIAGGSPQPNPPTEVTTKIADDGIIVSWKNPETHIDGSEMTDLSKINIYADDQLAGTAALPNISAGSYSQLKLALPAGKFYDISLVAVGTRGDTDTESVPSDTVFNYSGQPYTAFADNFDNAGTMIPTYTIGDTKWGITDKSAKSAPNSLTDSPDGDYSSRAENSIIFAPVVISQENPTLSWEHIGLIQSGDFGMVSVSKDLTNWDYIASFDINHSAEWKDDLASSSWLTDHRTLQNYIGDTLYIRFHLSTNFLKNGDGWYIDDLRLDADANSVEELNKMLSGIKINVSPNPIQNEAVLALNLTYPGQTGIEVYDAIGNRVASLHNGFLNPGETSINFSTEAMANGAYTIKVSVNGIAKYHRIIVNK